MAFVRLENRFQHSEGIQGIHLERDTHELGVVPFCSDLLTLQEKRPQSLT